MFLIDLIDKFLLHHNSLAPAADLQDVAAGAGSLEFQGCSGRAVPNASADNLPECVGQGVAGVLLDSRHEDVQPLHRNAVVDVRGYRCDTVNDLGVIRSEQYCGNGLGGKAQ